jgi:hypothetical protein
MPFQNVDWNAECVCGDARGIVGFFPSNYNVHVF